MWETTCWHHSSPQKSSFHNPRSQSSSEKVVFAVKTSPLVDHWLCKAFGKDRGSCVQPHCLQIPAAETCQSYSASNLARSKCVWKHIVVWQLAGEQGKIGHFSTRSACLIHLSWLSSWKLLWAILLMREIAWERHSVSSHLTVFLVLVWKAVYKC